MSRRGASLYPSNRVNVRIAAVSSFPPLVEPAESLTIDEVPPSLTFVGGALAIVGVLMTRRKPRART